jgi:hypothetical protein
MIKRRPISHNLTPAFEAGNEVVFEDFTFEGARYRAGMVVTSAFHGYHLHPLKVSLLKQDTGEGVLVTMSFYGKKRK